MDLGVILLNIKPSAKQNEIFKTLYDFIENRPYDQIVVFNSYCDIVDNYLVPILDVSQAKFFHGNILVFDTDSLFLASKFINTNKLFFYSTEEPPWAKDNKPYSYWKNIFENNNLYIITDSIYLNDLYSITWKDPIGISESFKYETLQHIIQ